MFLFTIKKSMLCLLLLLLLLCSCSSGGDDIVTQLIYNDECTGHGGISYNMSKAIALECDGIFCADGTCQPLGY